MKKLTYKGKIYVEYHQPILKSWMLSLLIGAVFGLIREDGWWAIFSFIGVVVGIFIVQVMYERELNEEVECRKL